MKRPKGKSRSFRQYKSQYRPKTRQARAEWRQWCESVRWQVKQRNGKGRR